MGRASKDRRDIFYRLAKEEGWRARSAFKLIHIDNYFKIFEGVTRAVDLCAAPGSWSQVLAQKLRQNSKAASGETGKEEEASVPEEEIANTATTSTGAPIKPPREPGTFTAYNCITGIATHGRAGADPDTFTHEPFEPPVWGSKANAIKLAAEAFDPEKAAANARKTFIVAVDLQTMSPIPGVDIIKGDITDERTAAEIIRRLGHSKAQLVVCDGAPDLTGLHQMDEFLQGQLLYSALSIAAIILEDNGTFVAKIFRSSRDGIETIYSRLKMFFEEVTIAKPRSSRLSSVEGFVVCQRFHLPEDYSANYINPFSKDYSTLNLEHRSPRDRMIINYVACGDLSGFNSDTTYPYNTKLHPSLPPVQPPIDPPYKEALRRRKAGLLGLTDDQIAAKLEAQAAKAKNKPQKQPKQIKPPRPRKIEIVVDPPEMSTTTLPIRLSFGGGLEALVSVVSYGKIETIFFLPCTSDEKAGIVVYTMQSLINFIEERMIDERPELFSKNGYVRPGILVLVNDVDWELLGAEEYELQSMDKVAFISTLHGG